MEHVELGKKSLSISLDILSFDEIEVLLALNSGYIDKDSRTL
jgi:hypothetical protein